MRITLNADYTVSNIEGLFGRLGENNSRIVKLKGSLSQEADKHLLRIQYPNENAFEIEFDVENELVLTGSVLCKANFVYLQIIAVKENEEGKYDYIKKSNLFKVRIEDSIKDDTDLIPPYETSKTIAMQVLEAEANAKKLMEDMEYINSEEMTNLIESAQTSAETAQSAADSVSSSVAQIEQNKADIALKLDKPETDGTAGQVLQLDEEGNTVWGDDTGTGAEVTEIDYKGQSTVTTDDTTVLGYYLDITSEDTANADLIDTYLSQKMQFGNRIVNSTVATIISVVDRWSNVPVGVTFTAKDGYLFRVYDGASAKSGTTWVNAFTTTETIATASVIVKKVDETEFTLIESETYTVANYEMYDADGEMMLVPVKNPPHEVTQEDMDAKLDKPEVDGTTGQILQLDENGKPIWASNSGGAEFTDIEKTASRTEATDDTSILDYYVDVTSEDETQAEIIADFVSQKMQYGNRVVNSTVTTIISTSLKYPNLPAGLTITAREGYLLRVYNGGSSKCTWSTTYTLTETIASAIVIVKREDEADLTLAETDLYTVETYDISYVDGTTKTVEVKKLSNEKAVFYGKVLSILGDSISTYGGDNYTTDSEGQKYADGTYTYLGNRVRYPQVNLNVTDVNKTYWKMLIDELDLVLGINESWAGTRVSWDGETEGRDVGALKHIACTTRIKHLGENGDPAYILVNAGTNDIVGDVEVGTFDYTNPMSLTEAEIEALPVDTFANAYRTMLIRLQYYYPDSQIIVLLPNYSSSYYTPDKADQYNETIKEACDYFGVLWIDARTCGVTMFNHDKYLPDTIHYNADGMVLLKRLLKNRLNSIIKGEPIW